jgi:hypothetical protein
MRKLISSHQYFPHYHTATGKAFQSKTGAEFVRYTETEKDLDLKIAKTRMMIEDLFPELSKSLDQLSAQIRNTQNNESRYEHLKTYYESLNGLFNKYRLEKNYRTK